MNGNANVFVQSRVEVAREAMQCGPRLDLELELFVAAIIYFERRVGVSTGNVAWFGRGSGVLRVGDGWVGWSVGVLKKKGFLSGSLKEKRKEYAGKHWRMGGHAS